MDNAIFGYLRDKCVLLVSYEEGILKRMEYLLHIDGDGVPTFAATEALPESAFVDTKNQAVAVD